jgi:hypothetical protein
MNYLYTFIAGAFIGVAALFVWQKPVEKAEPAAAEQVQSDGSLVLARDATAAKPVAPPRAPQGGKPIRSDTVTVRPTRTDCPACTVNLLTVEMKDGSHRVVANSPDGTVISGIDIPLVPINTVRQHVWAAGVSRGTGQGAWGLFVDRDLGPLRLGGEANKNGSGQYEARFRLGFVFQ